eukprot:scaffold15460_cov87-Amphora_coffeaeformis.AAC.1
MGMQDCNPSRTPMSNPLFPHATSDDHNGSFNYCSAIGTVDKGITIKPKTSDIALDCYVDADCAGHWISSEDDSPETVKSCAGYIISLGNAPVLWKSKRIHELCLSVMESEYIPLSMAMRSL